jgi:tetratricopeptide (TPR) repeat protein
VERYAQEGLYGNAIGVCRKILRQDPARVDTFEQLGGLFFSQGLAREAVKHYLDYASQMLRMGNGDAVRKTAERVREVLPTDGLVRERLAELHLSLSLPREALEDFQRAHAAYQGNGSTAEAERIAEKIRELEKDSSPSGGDLLDEPPPVESLPQELPPIEREGEGPIGISPETSLQADFPRQEVPLAVDENHVPLPTEEEEGAAPPSEEAPDPEASIEEVGGGEARPVPRAQEEDDFVPVDEILREFQDGVEKILDEKDYQSHYDMGMSFMEMGLYEEALSEFEHVSPSPELRGASEEMRATILLELGRAQEAVLILERLIEGGEEGSLGIHYLLGKAREELGDRAGALAEYRYVEKRDSGFRRVRERIAKVQK